MVFKTDIIVTFVGPYDFENEKKEQVKGTTVVYYDPMAPADPPARGFRHVKVTLPVGAGSMFPEVPARYNAEFRPVPGAGNKLVLRLVTAHLVDSVDIQDVPHLLRPAN